MLPETTTFFPGSITFRNYYEENGRWVALGVGRRKDRNMTESLLDRIIFSRQKKLDFKQSQTGRLQPACLFLFHKPKLLLTEVVTVFNGSVDKMILSLFAKDHSPRPTCEMRGISSPKNVVDPGNINKPQFRLRDFVSSGKRM
jgi:hypothetical protein